MAQVQLLRLALSSKSLLTDGLARQSTKGKDEVSKLYDEELSMRIAREIFTQEELEEILLFEEENEIDMDDLDELYEN